MSELLLELPLEALQQPARINLLGDTPEATERRGLLYDKMFPQQTITGNTVLDQDAHDTIWADPSGGSFDLTMPDPAVVLCREFTVKNISQTGGTVTLIGNIDGDTNLALTNAMSAVTVKSIGTGWMITSSHNIEFL